MWSCVRPRFSRFVGLTKAGPIRMTKAAKDFGKYTSGDLQAVLLLLPQFDKERGELQALIQKHPEKFSEKFLTTATSPRFE